MGKTNSYTSIIVRVPVVYAYKLSVDTLVWCNMIHFQFYCQVSVRRHRENNSLLLSIMQYIYEQYTVNYVICKSVSIDVFKPIILMNDNLCDWSELIMQIPFVYNLFLEPTFNPAASIDSTHCHIDSKTPMKWFVGFNNARKCLSNFIGHFKTWTWTFPLDRLSESKIHPLRVYRLCNMILYVWSSRRRRRYIVVLHYLLIAVDNHMYDTMYIVKIVIIGGMIILHMRYARSLKNARGEPGKKTFSSSLFLSKFLSVHVLTLKLPALGKAYGARPIFCKN